MESSNNRKIDWPLVGGNLFLAFPLGLGFLGVYRGKQPDENLLKFSATVHSKNIHKYSTGRSGPQYSLDLSFKEIPDVYGIFLGNKESAQRSKTIDDIDIGQNYIIHVDKTYPVSQGHNLGINLILSDGKVVYQRDRTTDFEVGLALMIFGVILLFLFNYLKRKEKLVQSISKN